MVYVNLTLFRQWFGNFADGSESWEARTLLAMVSRGLSRDGQHPADLDDPDLFTSRGSRTDNSSPAIQNMRSVTPGSQKDLQGIADHHSAKRISFDSSHLSDQQQRLVTIIDSFRFEMFVGFIIVFNAVLMGIEIEQRLSGEVTFPWAILELVFTLTYTIELSLRLYAFGRATVKCRWCKSSKATIPAALTNAWV